MSLIKTISILLAEDHAIVRQGLNGLLSRSGFFQIVGEARNGREAVGLARSLRPDVILMDIAMPVLNGLEATRQILAQDASAKIIILSAHSDDEYVDQTTQVGVRGFLEKQTSADILIHAIREVAAGRPYLSPSIVRRRSREPFGARDRAGRPRDGARQLTSREAEVLQLVAEGSANKQVAAILQISIKTVEKHRQNLMNKLDIHDTAGLTRYALSHGVIENATQLTIL